MLPALPQRPPPLTQAASSGDAGGAAAVAAAGFAVSAAGFAASAFGVLALLPSFSAAVAAAPIAAGSCAGLKAVAAAGFAAGGVEGAGAGAAPITRPVGVAVPAAAGAKVWVEIADVSSGFAPAVGLVCAADCAALRPLNREPALIEPHPASAIASGITHRISSFLRIFGPDFSAITWPKPHPPRKRDCKPWRESVENKQGTC